MDSIKNSPKKNNFINLKRTLNETDLKSEDRETVGGKAQGLMAMRNLIVSLNEEYFPDIMIAIPSMTVVTTDVFDAFIKRNRLHEIAFSALSDSRIAHAFQQAEMPFEVLGLLRNLIEKVTCPLAVRSSGMLEDITNRPFAGVYQTKMIPNNQYDADTRFQKLVEAIKYVWASTYYKISRDYCKAIGRTIQEEKMAVIIQEIVGKRYRDRYYPELSGVARSYNFYPVKPARSVDRVVDLALGMGKTVVDGGKTWTYSPEFPQMPPPFESIHELLQETQNKFWVVNLGKLEEYNPIKETEFMFQKNLLDAEEDKSLRFLASTYDPQSDRLSIGTGMPGPRALTFAPLLSINEVPFNSLIKTLLEECEKKLQCPVEIEFAMTFNPHYFGFLQVRPLLLPQGDLQVTQEDLENNEVLAASEMVLGNGLIQDICDIVYVLPQKFELKYTRQIATQLEGINDTLIALGRPYLLIVFGRLGTFDPWLGIPISWGQISGARVIVEATQDNVKVELSQGSHYFHNIINLGVQYFSMPFTSTYRIDWDWLAQQPIIQETEFIRHVALPAALKIKADGRTSRGVIFKT
ncbi:MAG: hypothetical protein E4H13_09220 [Calditrichales bacterium]|nr:MAG: hypothetical protein E4H13_09220 [Calditrichales bacterium]